MPNQNPLDALVSNSTPEQTPAPALSGSSNPLDSLFSGGGGTPAPVATPVSSNPLDRAFGVASSPLSGQPVQPTGPAQHLYQDTTQPFYKRAWDFANTPLTESLFGLPEDRPGAGGFERGVEHIASGLTSPLSVALTAATFGTGGLIESAGATALKEAGLTAAEIADASKASQIAVDTARAMPAGETAITDAVKEAGLDPDKWKQAQDILYKNGLSEHDLLGGNALERGAFQILRKTLPEVPIAATVRMAKTANTMLNAGFTYQQLESASAMSPRFLDALKDGDYDKAMEYGTEALASGTLAILGGSHALHSAGELFKPLLESDAVRPSDEWVAIQRANGEREAQHAVAEQEAIKMSQQAKTLLGHADARPVIGDSAEVSAQKKLELASVLHQVVTGGDANKAADWYDSLAEAAGKDDRISTNSEAGFNRWFGNSKVADENDKPLSVYHGTKKDFSEFKDAEGQNYGYYFTDSPKYAESYSGVGVPGGNIRPSYVKIENPATWQQFEDALKTHKDSAVQELQRQGYDGIIGTKGEEWGGIDTPDKDAKLYVAFSPEQIKSSIGSRPNNGQTASGTSPSPEVVKDAGRAQTSIAPIEKQTGLSGKSVDVKVNFPPLKESEPAWRKAADSQPLSQQFSRTGIPGFSIDEPYKFGLSEQGNIDPGTGKISINSAVENPEHTLAHELAHDIYNRLSSSDKANVDTYMKSNEQVIYPEHAGGLEEKVADHFADVLLGKAEAPPSVKKSFFDSPLLPRKQRAQSLEPIVPARKFIGNTWADVARSGGSLNENSDIRGLVKKDGDFPLVIKDTTGARHVVPASIAADVLDSPAHAYVREVFMAKDHDYEYSASRLQADIAQFKAMLASGKFQPTGFSEPPPLTPAYTKELQDRIVKYEKLLEDKKAGVPYTPKALYPTDTIRLTNGGERVITDAIKTAENRKLLGDKYNSPKLIENREVEKPSQETPTPSPNNGLPPNIADMIQNNKFKDQPKEYQDLVLNSLRRVATGALSEKELAAAKFLRDEQDRNFEIGSQHDLLHSYIDDYMTRVYQDTNPEGRVISSNAKSGQFATNVSMAKHRVYDSNLTALLKSPKQMLLDPVDITAQGRAQLIKAAANKALIDNLRDKFTRASDGRPAVVLSGAGQVISGQNGEDPKIFIDPNRVRKINIAPSVVEQLSKSGELQRYMDEGTIRDITPYVRANNIGAAIDRIEEQTQRKDAQYDEVGNNKLRTQLMYLKSMQANGDFSGLRAFNDGLEKQYAWDPQDYINMDHSAMKGWNFVTNSADGTPVYVRSDIRVHPEFAQYLKDRLGLEKSGIANNPIGKAALGAGSALKHTLLSLSPFHMAQEALRAIMVGVNPIGLAAPDILSGERVDPSDPSSPTIIRKAVEHGFTTGTDYKALQAHSEGVSSGGGILKLIPVIGKSMANALNSYQDFLFKKYIPALKARAVEHMYHEYQSNHPEWSVDRVAKAAAIHTNDTFGGVQWKALGRSVTTQDTARALLLAPDWLESEIRSVSRLFNKDEGDLGRAQFAKMSLGLWGVSRVLNLVSTGSPHLENPFGVTVKNKDGKEIQFGIRTLPTDALHMAANPVDFIRGRLSPTIGMATEFATGRDRMGRKLQPADLWADVFRNTLPIPVQSVDQAITNTGPEVGNPAQIWKSVGGTATSYASPAQKMAAELASNHSESGPIDPAQMARHRTVMEFEDKLRSGQMTWPDMMKLTYETDQIHPDELKKIQNNVKATQGMTPDMASMYTRASRLPASEFLNLWDISSPRERVALTTLMVKNQKRYLDKAKKDMTPEERQKDPVFQRFLNMIPQRSSF